jgi:hypothetical protein
VTAAAPALGWETPAFLDAYTQNRDDAHAVAVEGSPVAQAVYTLACKATPWKGTATELLAALKAQAVLGHESLQSLPKNARALSASLRRLAPNLRALGVTITFTRDSDKLRTRRIAIGDEGSARG